MKTILLIDNDLGVLFWLGRILDEAGFRAFPAKSCWDANQLLSEFDLRVDLFALNPTLAGAVGFVHALRRDLPNAKIVALLNEDGDGATVLPQADGIYRKPGSDELQASVEWVKLTLSLLGDSVD